MRLVKRSEILLLWGITALLLGFFIPEDFVVNHDILYTWSIIFITGSIITSAVEEKKCRT